MRLLFTITAFFCLCSKTYSQDSRQLNYQMQELIHDQIEAKLAVDLNVLLFLPVEEDKFYFVFFFDFSFQEADKTFQFKKGFKSLDRRSFRNKELLKEIDFNFIPELKDSTVLLMKAKRGGDYLYDLKFSRNSNTESLKIESFDKEYSKTIDFINGKLKSLHVKKPSTDIIVESKQVNDSIRLTIKFDVMSKNYQTTEELFQNDLLISRKIFKKSKSKTERKLKRLYVYKYDNNGRLLSEEILNSKSKIIDINVYGYNNSKLTSITNQETVPSKSIFYVYKNEKLQKKVFLSKGETKTNKIDVLYRYNQQGLLASMEILRKGFEISQMYFFKYDKNSLLISIKSAFQNLTTSKIKFHSENIFDYNEDNIIESIKQFNDVGELINSIDYEIHKMDESY